MFRISQLSFAVIKIQVDTIWFSMRFFNYYIKLCYTNRQECNFLAPWSTMASPILLTAVHVWCFCLTIFRTFLYLLFAPMLLRSFRCTNDSLQKFERNVFIKQITQILQILLINLIVNIWGASSTQAYCSFLQTWTKLVIMMPNSGSHLYCLASLLRQQIH